MKLLMYIVLFPCALGAEILCSNGHVCPEGTYCCGTQGEEIRCCHKNNSDIFLAADPRKMAAVFPPAIHPYVFPNNTEPDKVLRAYCVTDCGLRPCCNGECCPFVVGRCCKRSCCRSGYQCCGNVYVGDKEWCCPYDKKCSTYVKGLCVNGAMTQMQSISLMLIISVLSIALRYSFI